MKSFLEKLGILLLLIGVVISVYVVIKYYVK